jgi:hypothetical protein
VGVTNYGVTNYGVSCQNYEYGRTMRLGV